MLDFLNGCGINNDTVREMIEVNSSANLYNFNCNQDEIVKMIDYLKMLGINCIDKLLIYRIDMFYVSFDKFRELFDKPDVSKYVQLINEDYTVIDEF